MGGPLPYGSYRAHLTGFFFFSSFFALARRVVAAWFFDLFHAGSGKSALCIEVHPGLAGEGFSEWDNNGVLASHLVESEFFRGRVCVCMGFILALYVQRGRFINFRAEWVYRIGVYQ